MTYAQEIANLRAELADATQALAIAKASNSVEAIADAADWIRSIKQDINETEQEIDDGQEAPQASLSHVGYYE